MRKTLKVLLVIIIFVVSFGLMAYPFISNYLFEHRKDGVIDVVEKAAENGNKEEFKEDIAAAIEYNDDLLNGHVQLKDPFIEDMSEEGINEYNSLLNMTEDGVMGFIKIPSIDVSLPIYHGTSEEILELGAGHLQGTSLPVGGKGTHSVITGHTGLSSAKLFTDLTELENGDMFFLHVMGKKLAYKVDNIKVILPDEMDSLEIDKDKDYCTLITCTPYGVNTHRLLVRGIRTDYEEAVEEPEVFVKKKTQSKWMKEYAKSLIIAGSVFFVLLVLLAIWRVTQSKKENKKKKKKSIKDFKI